MRQTERKRQPQTALEPRKQPRQERSSRMVDRILDAALILTREKGTAGPTTLAIAQRAGLSVGSVYQYYPNKQAIMLDLARRWLSAFPAVIAARVNAAPPAGRGALEHEVRAFLHEVARLYLDNANLLPVLEAIALNPDLRPIMTESDERIVGLYAAWLHRLNPALEAETASRLGLLMMEVGHISLTLAVRRDRSTFDLILRDLETMWLALITPHLELA
jgi:AcrR family transcriptional regulator